MVELNYDFTDKTPPTGLSRRGRWAEAHFVVQKAVPGQWVVFKDLTPKDASSLRTALKSKVEDVVARQQEDGTVHLWALRCAAPTQRSQPTATSVSKDAVSKDATVAPEGIATSTASSLG